MNNESLIILQIADEAVEVNGRYILTALIPKEVDLVFETEELANEFIETVNKKGLPYRVGLPEEVN